nr:ribonuclease H-like domain-containing protein [Tanacetum cinerariifolium]
MYNLTDISNPQHTLKDKGVIDSGCSRHMIENISYLSEFEEINGGYVAFGESPKGGKITGKGFQEHFDVGKAGKGNVQQYVLFPLWSTCSKDPQNTNADATFEVKEPEGGKYSTICDFPLWSTGSKDPQNTNANATFEVKEPEFEVHGIVTKPHNKITYELLLGRTPSIGFLRPFGCLVTILNTLDLLAEILRKFGLTDGKVASAPIDTEKPLLKDPDGEDVIQSSMKLLERIMHVTNVSCAS